MSMIGGDVAFEIARTTIANREGAEKKVRHIGAEDYEAQKLWRDVVLQNISRGTSAAIAIDEADTIAQSYIKFINTQENK